MHTYEEDGPAVVVDAAALARVGTALADESRRRLLLALLAAPAYPSELAERLGLTRGNVSNHLSRLRDCGLVRAVAVGRRVRYEPADPKLAHALADLAALLPPAGRDGGEANRNRAIGDADDAAIPAGVLRG
ncbi:helix-turn-helix domain-containing protein [Embleya scabrispora]|uniref:helix-turn-helix domain-containing protein n=1 Tax=Embleya scabrispora TaxID=159449 RepID=UPI001F43CB76|nr:helix-turn-helix domain-containing protein [Embleya scabrispora]